MNAHLGGVWAASLTPLDDDLDPDVGRLVAHLERLFDAGCDGAVLFGTTGEATSFSVAERQQVLESILAAGADPDRLIVGVGCAAPVDTVTLTRHAGRHGVAGTLMLPPFYYKGLSDDDLRGAFDWIFTRVAAVSPPVLLYHIPQVSGVGVSPALAGRLVEGHPGLVRGIKDSSGSAESLHAFLAAMPGAAVFTGNELLLPTGLAGGAAGTISGPANVHSATIRELFDSRGANEKALAHLHAFRADMSVHQAVPALKAVMADRLRDPGWSRVRPPLAPLPLEAGRRLNAVDGSVPTPFGV